MADLKNDSGTFKTRGTILIHRPNALNRPCQGRVLCGNQDACLASYVRALFEPSTLADLARSIDAEASSKHCSPKCRSTLWPESLHVARFAHTVGANLWAAIFY